MRNPSALIVLFAISFVFTSASQESKSLKSRSTQAASVLSPEKVEEIQKQIAQIDGHFQAIESKKSYVLADSVEKAKALESGWFEDMEGIQQRLLDRKTSLLLILNDGQYE